MKDLIEKGLSEQEAFERAKEELKFSNETTKSSDLQDKFAEYYKNYDPSDYEVIGLFDAGFMFLGLSIGALTGFITSGGREMFLSGGWIDTLIGGVAGIIIGLGIGQISHAIIILKKKDESKSDCMPNVIEIENLRKSFIVKLKGRTTTVEAVCGITLSVKSGEIFGFLGPNGAGKTTTLRMLTTLLPIDDGKAAIYGPVILCCGSLPCISRWYNLGYESFLGVCCYDTAICDYY